jgi:hypothetical protein
MREKKKLPDVIRCELACYGKHIHFLLFAFHSFRRLCLCFSANCFFCLFSGAFLRVDSFVRFDVPPKDTLGRRRIRGTNEAVLPVKGQLCLV